MAKRKKGIEIELIVAGIRTKDDVVTLDLRFTKPRFKELTEEQLEKAIQPWPKTQAEKVGRDVAKGYLDEVQKQVRASVRSLAEIIPPTSSPNTIQITLSKQEYEEIGRPRAYDKLSLKLMPL